MYYSRPSARIKITQEKLNNICERTPFELGDRYAEIVSMYIFACFYASLQPLVVPLTIICFILMYFAEKVVLFKYSKRPVPGYNDTHEVMYWFIYLGPLAYALGSFMWIDAYPGDYVAIIPNSIALIIGILIFVFPYSFILKKFMRKPPIVRPGLYNKNRLFMPT